MFSSHNLSDFRRHADPSSPGSVEPMTLGSPISSPKSIAAGSQHYLPPFLFGEVVTSPVGATTWSTPTKQHGMSFSSPQAAQQVAPITHTMRDKKNLFQSPIPSSLINSPSTGKSGGPPVQGLIYSTTSPATSFNAAKLDNTPTTPSVRVSGQTTFSGILTPSKTFSINNSSHLSPAQMDPFFTQGEALKTSDQLDDSWVTVFGFPAASTSYILQQFSQYGNIVEHKMSPLGNWMHIQYQSKLQAKKALSKDGKIFGGNIMIGVKPCIEMDLMESTKENSIQASNTVLGEDSFTVDVMSPSKPNLKNIRPLTQAYSSPSFNTEAPLQKSGSIMSKAFQYIWKL